MKMTFTEKMISVACIFLLTLTIVMVNNGVHKNNEAVADELTGCAYYDSSAKGTGFTQCSNNNPSPALVAAVTGGAQ